MLETRRNGPAKSVILDQGATRVRGAAPHCGCVRPAALRAVLALCAQGENVADVPGFWHK